MILDLYSQTIYKVTIITKKLFKAQYSVKKIVNQSKLLKDFKNKFKQNKIYTQ